ncbi:MAG: MoaD family protein [Deltaproteobacteria bacterium]|nr:MoaD family protein [Sandaracinaceae bacterium]MCX7807417.1 MoaD family protein [Deltaproteobacteria bacterium]MDW8247523.1 MoaD family protein [Sandaracinaceae bacterium]
MAVTVRIPTPLRNLTQGRDEVEAHGKTLRDVIEDLESRYPGLRERLLDEQGIRRHVNIFIGEEDVRFLQGLETPVREGDAIHIIPALAGGK